MGSTANAHLEAVLSDVADVADKIIIARDLVQILYMAAQAPAGSGNSAAICRVADIAAAHLCEANDMICGLLERAAR